MPRVQKKNGQRRGQESFSQAQAKRPQVFGGLSLRAAQFGSMFKSAKKTIYKKSLAVFYKENTLSSNRYGFVIPKKIVHLSTRRNRSRRCLREACRINQSKIKSGFDIIFYSYKDINSLEEAEKLLIPALDLSGLLSQK